jgi:hypothetical protein
MPAPKGRYPLARYDQVPEHAERLRMSRCWMQVQVGNSRLLLRPLIGGTANNVDNDRAAGGHRRRARIEVE